MQTELNIYRGPSGSKPFDPSRLLNPYQLTLWEGGLTGGGILLNAPHLFSARSLALTKIQFSQLTKDDNFIPGTGQPLGAKYVEMQDPQKQTRIFADPQIGEELLNESGQFCLKYIASLGISCIEFFGGILRDVDGNPCILVLTNEADGWRASARRFNQVSEPNNFALVLDVIG